MAATIESIAKAKDKRKRAKEEGDFSWEMDLVNSNRSYQLLVRSMIKFHKHLKIANDTFNPPTVVWTGRSYILDDISEILQYQADYGATDEYVPIILSRFPGMKKLCAKHEMSDRLNIFRDFYPDKYDFYPRTWNVHTDMNQINKLFDSKTRDIDKCYILKTGVGCQGSGISIVFSLKEIFNAIDYHTSLSKSDLVPLILQEYCNNPLLTKDGYKFDFRLYVVLKSLDPLEFYVCRDGLCRICTVKYHPVTRSNAQCAYMHFTNFHLNKDNRASARTRASRISKLSDKLSRKNNGRPSGQRRRSQSSETLPSTRSKSPKSQSKERGPAAKSRSSAKDRATTNQIPRKSKTPKPTVPETDPKEKVIKRSVDEMLFMIKDEYRHLFDIKSFWDQIDQIVHKTLVTLALPLKWHYAENFPVHASGQYEGSNCFHIIGFDILMDDAFRCYLLEINDAPSFSVDSQMDFSIKSSIMESTLQIVGAFHNETDVDDSLKHNIRDFVPFQSKRGSLSNTSAVAEQKQPSSSREASPTLDLRQFCTISYIDDLYSVEERATLRCRYKKFVFKLPSDEWYRDRRAIIGQSRHPRGHSNLFRIFEDPMISKIFAVYSTRYGWINAIKFIQFCEDFKISNFVQKFSRSHLDLLYREYQAKICGKGGGELDLEGFAYVLLMLARKKQSRYKTRSILQVWLELIAHLYATQKTAQRRRKCIK